MTVKLDKMPSIKKRVTGFIRQFSAPAGSSSERSDKSGGKKNNVASKSTSPQSPNPGAHNLPECFIQKYLNG